MKCYLKSMQSIAWRLSLLMGVLTFSSAAAASTFESPLFKVNFPSSRAPASSHPCGSMQGDIVIRHGFSRASRSQDFTLTVLDASGGGTLSAAYLPGQNPDFSEASITPLPLGSAQRFSSTSDGRLLGMSWDLPIDDKWFTIQFKFVGQDGSSVRYACVDMEVTDVSDDGVPMLSVGNATAGLSSELRDRGETFSVTANMDVEERYSTGEMLETDSLDLFFNQDMQQVGLRFDLYIPTSGYVSDVRLHLDEYGDASANAHVPAGSVTMRVRAELSGAARPFRPVKFDLSKRTLTSAQVRWTMQVPAGGGWGKTTSPDLSPLLSELIVSGQFPSSFVSVVLVLDRFPQTVDSSVVRAAEGPTLTYVVSSSPIVGLCTDFNPQDIDAHAVVDVGCMAGDEVCLLTCEQGFEVMDAIQGSCSIGSWQGVRVTCHAVDLCQSSPCLNSGRCESLLGEYVCHCKKGFTGTKCEEGVDSCSPNPCLNNGVCTKGSKKSSFNCRCPSWVQGTRCQSVTSHCAYAPCKNGGNCVPGITTEQYTCQCPAGFSGATCATELRPCDSLPCFNGGTCTNQKGLFNCSCRPGYSGRTCEIVTDPCVLSPCQNGGTCSKSTFSPGYTCTCPTFYSGPNCASVVGACFYQPCENGGTCREANDKISYTCSCADGFMGMRCSQKDNSPCSSQPCLNSGLCRNDGKGGFECSCKEGFAGPQCAIATQPCFNEANCCKDACSNGVCHQVNARSFYCDCNAFYVGPSCQTVTSACAFSPCQNGAVCHANGLHGFNCVCPIGFIGTLCTQAVQLCPDAPCRNSGLCKNGQQCVCPYNTWGNYCEILLDQCESSPCLNGGTCMDVLREKKTDGSLTAAFQCQCPVGFRGRTCQQADGSF